MKKILSLISLCLVSSSVFAYGVGQITHPLKKNGHMISGEFTGIMSNGSGVGVQGRYTRKIKDKLKLDGGIGLAAGDRSFRLFSGASYELYPDYANQPKVDLKAGFEVGSEFGNTVTTLSITPIASKGLNLWGLEGYPFVAFPIGVGLNGDSKTYETIYSITAGWTGKIPVKQMDKFTASVEMNLGLKDSYTGMFLGLAYPL
jgi:hypothetical protein